jgi:hypothetical protein
MRKECRNAARVEPLILALEIQAITTVTPMGARANAVAVIA